MATGQRLLAIKIRVQPAAAMQANLDGAYGNAEARRFRRAISDAD
jgi:hypothetical protein